MEEKDMTGERLATVEAKLDMLIDSVKQLVTKAEYEELKRRVERLENAPSRWLSHIIAGASLLIVMFDHFRG